MVASVSVHEEQETPYGWEFAVDVTAADHARRHRVHLSWQDYERWSHGTAAPAEVVRLMMQWVSSRPGCASLRDRLDASTLCRTFPGLDEAMTGRFV